MSSVQAIQGPKFLRKTTLGNSETNKNFKMLDNDVADAVTSVDADRITPLMSKIYMRLLLTPEWLREGERVLRFAGEEREGEWVTAWEQLRGHLRVSGETASKALSWMHEQGIIGYHAGKNGVGIRIFLNRAASSVATRPTTRPQKILPFTRASESSPRTSLDVTPFNDSYAVREVLETDKISVAPKNGADTGLVVKKVPDPTQPALLTTFPNMTPSSGSPQTQDVISLEDLVTRLKVELEPVLQTTTRQAAAREHERTREWLESRGLPKAARVAQREAFNVLRQHGLGGVVSRERISLAVGAEAWEGTPVGARPLSPEEVRELGETCVAMLEVHGQAIDVTLAELSAEVGGILLTEDAPRVRELAESMAGGGREG